GQYVELCHQRAISKVDVAVGPVDEELLDDPHVLGGLADNRATERGRTIPLLLPQAPLIHHHVALGHRAVSESAEAQRLARQIPTGRNRPRNRPSPELAAPFTRIVAIDLQRAVL